MSSAPKAEAGIDAELVPGLICPRCLESVGYERSLDSRMACPQCATRYPLCAGIPVLIADDQARASITGTEPPNDPRCRFYQADGEDYLRQKHDGRRRIEQALAGSSAAGIVLEIGSGRGLFAGVGGNDYCALDYSLSFLRSYLTGYRRLCASAQNLPLPSGSCRFVFSVATLEHVEHPDRAFAEVDRVLAVGGVVYMDPAWHCRDWAAEGLAVRPWSELTARQRLRKALIPLRDSLWYRGATQIPWRIWRRAITAVGQGPSWLRYGRLRANYEHFWVADSDACSAIDSHEGLLFFESRGYQILQPQGGTMARLLFRAGPVIARKTSRFCR